MGRYKKGVKLVRSDLWEKVGGTDFIVKKLLNADILNRNTAKSSDLWSQLAIDLFTDDTPRNRAWIWENWRINRQGIRERVHLAAEGVGRGHHHTGREVEPEVQGKRIKSQY